MDKIYYCCPICLNHKPESANYLGHQVYLYCPYCKQSTHHYFYPGENNNMKTTMTRRFYSTRSAIQRPQFLGLLTEAIEDAKRKLAEHPEHDEYYIVEIKKIVRREEPKPPITIVDVE